MNPLSYLQRIIMRLNHIFRALNAGKGSPLSIIIGISSLVFTIYFSEWFAGSYIWAWIGLIGFASIALIIFVGWRSLHFLTPSEFAEITLAGQSVSNILTVISYEMWKACYAFVDTNKNIHKIFEGQGPPKKRFNQLSENEVLELANFVRVEKFLLQKEINKQIGLALKQHRVLQKLLAMKLLAAKELNIPPRRLCDYFFQYSPEMHKAKLRKYIQNWNEIITLLEDYREIRDPINLERLDGLYRENQRIYWKFESRLNYLKQIIKFRDLHAYVHSFASEHSTSGSLKTYARAISDVSDLFLSNWKSNSYSNYEPSEFGDFCERLKFLFYKQRAHPGFDLNYACFRLCLLHSESLRDVPDVAKRSTNQAKILNALRHKQMVPIKWSSPEQVLREIKDLSKLFEDVNRAIDESRFKIIANFVERYTEWCEPSSDSKKFILTHGYSKTVREVLKRGLKEISERLMANNKSGSSTQFMPRILIMNSYGEDEFDTRLMNYDLMDDSEYPPLNDISVGNEELFSKLIDDDSILVILGAECFDEEKRVLHPRGLDERLSNLKNSAISRCEVVVVAEEYKYHESLIAIPEFYRHHLDRLYLYEPDVVDVIISDKS